MRRWPQIDPGEMVHRVAIQAQTQAQDALGGQTETWNTVLTIMAALATTASKELYQTGQFTGQVTHRVSIYWPGAGIAILGGMRVVYGSRIFIVQTVENVQERNCILLLHCLEIDGTP